MVNRNVSTIVNSESQTVNVPSFKLLSAQPSFLDGRDAILLALDDMRDAGQP